MNKKVLFNIPNIIGYFRIILLISASYTSNITFLYLYGLSSSLDFVDGYAARYFNQSSILGACLDMITDRCSNIIIGLRIIRVLPRHYIFISLYILIDLISHFIHFNYSTIVSQPHKENTNIFLQVYYTKPVLFIVCLASEAFFMSILYYGYVSKVVKILYVLTLLKMFFHIVQLKEAVCNMSKLDK